MFIVRREKRKTVGGKIKRFPTLGSIEGGDAGSQYESIKYGDGSGVQYGNGDTITIVISDTEPIYSTVEIEVFVDTGDDNQTPGMVTNISSISVSSEVLSGVTMSVDNLPTYGELTSIDYHTFLLVLDNPNLIFDTFYGVITTEIVGKPSVSVTVEVTFEYPIT